MNIRLVALVLVSIIADQQQFDDHAHHRGSASGGDAQIIVTINPEARVSAVVAAPMPSPPRCGEATEIKVQIINRGLVTAPLRASLVDSEESEVVLHMDAAKLSGRPEDTRLLHLTPRTSNATDVTVAFSIDNNIGDVGERDRVHFLIKCTGQR